MASEVISEHLLLNIGGIPLDPKMLSPCALSQLYHTGAGTVAAVAPLATTLFNPYINIYNLLSAITYAYVYIQLSCSSLLYAINCVHAFLLKVDCKVIKIVPVGRP